MSDFSCQQVGPASGAGGEGLCLLVHSAIAHGVTGASNAPHPLHQTCGLSSAQPLLGWRVTSKLQPVICPPLSQPCCVIHHQTTALQSWLRIHLQHLGFGGHGRQLLQLCQAAGLVLGTGRLHGDQSAPLTFPCAQGGSRPDHLLLDVDFAPACTQLNVNSTLQDSDHFPFSLSIQCLRLSTGLHPSSNGDTLPSLAWDMSCRQAYATTLTDGRLSNCIAHAQRGDPHLSLPAVVCYHC